MSISGLDHIALPTNQPIAMMEFYRSLGFTIPDEKLWRDVNHPTLTIHCGTPGCGDMCFVWDESLDSLLTTLEKAGARIEVGPVERNGAQGPGTSVYSRDPNENLIEFIIYEG